MTERAPLLLRIVGWITIFSGLLQIVAGFILLIAKDDVLEGTAAYTSDELTAFAIAAIVIGLIYFLVGRGFLRLSGWALSLGVVVSTLAILGNVIYLMANESNHEGVIGSLVINAIVLIACFGGFTARSQ